ncbi:MAG: hypothetical protein E5V36_03230, partial [Mesorhizobium sp.]
MKMLNDRILQSAVLKIGRVPAWSGTCRAYWSKEPLRLELLKDTGGGRAHEPYSLLGAKSAILPTVTFRFELGSNTKQLNEALADIGPGGKVAEAAADYVPISMAYRIELAIQVGTGIQVVCAAELGKAPV